jgi:hypothetical protein
MIKVGLTAAPLSSPRVIIGLFLFATIFAVYFISNLDAGCFLQGIWGKT